MKPKEQAQFDQDVALMLANLPMLWRGLFLKLIEEGFTEAQSLDLTKAFIQKPS